MIRNESELLWKCPWLADYPNMTKYILKYGMNDLIPVPWVAKDNKSAEKIYGQCVSSGKSWRYVLDIKEGKEGVVY